ncbi:MAG: DJ-1/PfpI family protein [Candidatus Heimdallarchaeota archaeon]|nr:DJ-1/PfpI family protein [Candidatus Heimdallarchaeota archaeon]MCK4290078.1 DJ-1/PfpI family protein [Candidatus Heimdallarchaeota archaeon]
MNNKNAYLFLYDQFVDFEVIQALLLLRDNYNLTTVGFQKGLVDSFSNLKVEASVAIEDVNIGDVDVFIIPGGEPKDFIRNEKYTKKIQNLNDKLIALAKNEKIIAAICGGPTFLANAGILDGNNCTASIDNEGEEKFYEKSTFKDTDYVLDKNILTAQGHAFTDFAVQLAKLCGVLKTDEEVEQTRNWLRNIE